MHAAHFTVLLQHIGIQMGVNNVFLPRRIIDLHALGVGQNGVGHVADEDGIPHDLEDQITELLEVCGVGKLTEQIQF